MGKRNKATYIENDLGEKRLLDKLIVMDDVFGLADKSDDFANFLTVSRKYGITGIYIFHTIYCNRQNWQMVMSQTEIFIKKQKYLSRNDSLMYQKHDRC